MVTEATRREEAERPRLADHAPQSYTGYMRARPQRIVIERGGGPGGETLRAEIDPANMPADIAASISQLLDEARPPVTDDGPSGTAYDIVLDYGDRRDRLRYDEDELSGDILVALDARLKPSG